MEWRKIEFEYTNHPGWGTADELKFLRQIAERKDGTAFAGYAASLDRRENWGKIDRQAVTREVLALQARRNGAEASSAA